MRILFTGATGFFGKYIVEELRKSHYPIEQNENGMVVYLDGAYYLSDELDREDFIPDAYILEVSSPGLGRPLKKDKDFARSIGEEVEIKLFKPIDKQKE